jgi:hypothetical protein
MDGDKLRERVAEERRQRGWLSVRSAAVAATEAGASISYTTWNDWESGKRPLGDSMRRAVMLLFDWPYGWPENPPPAGGEVSPPDDPAGGWVSLAQHVDLHRRVEELAEQVRVMGAEVERLSRSQRRGAQ